MLRRSPAGSDQTPQWLKTLFRADNAQVRKKEKLMKKQISILTMAALLASCAVWQSTGITTSTAVAAGVATGLRFVPITKRAEVASYIDVYAVALRSIEGTPTDAELITLINSFVPESVRLQYPELVAIATPLITTTYHLMPKYQTLLDIATGFEAGAAPFLVKP